MQAAALPPEVSLLSLPSAGDVCSGDGRASCGAVGTRDGVAGKVRTYLGNHNIIESNLLAT